MRKKAEVLAMSYIVWTPHISYLVIDTGYFNYTVYILYSRFTFTINSHGFTDSEYWYS